MLIKISSRKSALAKVQAYAVAAALKTHHPDLKIEMNFKESLGDINLTDPLWKIPEKGVFTEDFNQDLASGAADIVVHSWKDLPTELKKDSQIIATLPRADQRDLLIVKKSHRSHIETTKTIRLFSSSPRRAYTLEPFLKAYYPLGLDHVQFESVRGNVPTRIQKLLDNPNIDGMIVAKAAMDRLLSCSLPEFQNEFKDVQATLAKQFKQFDWMVLPLSMMPNAAAQGALAIEALNHRKDLITLFEPINHKDTFLTAESEREELSRYGGGCHQKIGITFWNHKYGLVKFLKGLTHEGVFLDESSLLCNEHLTLKNKFSENDLWSTQIQLGPQKSFFDRAALDFNSLSDLNQTALFFAKKEALAHLDVDQIKQAAAIWTAGLSTWKTLATKGIWVNGSTDQLGEAHEQNLQPLVPSSVKWLKLTHTESHQHTLAPKALATYQLKRNSEAFDFENKKCFYWSSGSLFLAAIKEHPALIHKIHCCGLGNTAETIRETLKEHLKSDVYGKNFFVFYNEEQWRKICLQ